jgi:hypothetical protein
MKFHSAAIASVSVLAPLSAAWNVAIYDSLDQECNEEYMRYVSDGPICLFKGA